MTPIPGGTASARQAFGLAPDEIIVDSFAGGGGASLGIEMALGRSPDIAINHDREAIAMHAANHPTTKHYPEDVWKVDPVVACAGRRVASCGSRPTAHFSKASAGSPSERQARARARVGRGALGARRQAAHHLPRERREFATGVRSTPSRTADPIRKPARPEGPLQHVRGRLAPSATRSSGASCAPATTARRRAASASSWSRAATASRSCGPSPRTGRGARSPGAPRPSASTGGSRARRSSSRRARRGRSARGSARASCGRSSRRP
jgi:hypothetical protein